MSHILLVDPRFFTTCNPFQCSDCRKDAFIEDALCFNATFSPHLQSFSNHSYNFSASHSPESSSFLCLANSLPPSINFFLTLPQISRPPGPSTSVLYISLVSLTSSIFLMYLTFFDTLVQSLYQVSLFPHSSLIFLLPILFMAFTIKDIFKHFI